ncbi:MAG: sugar ABC transporter permease [Clostridia bacterium]|nr:sugar ABC transporter permease [Clostridia bacterium]
MKATPTIRNKGLQRDSLQAILMILPFLIGFILFSYVPIIYILRYAVTDFNGYSTANFTGLHNFHRIFTSDPDFWMSLLNTVILSFCKLLVEIPLALLLATLLNQKLRGIGFFRVTLFMPAVISAAIIGLIFSLLFASFNGTVNTILQNVGLIGKPINWFGSKWSAMLVLGIASVWQNYGINMMFFLMALQSIPQEIYECAELDGAHGLRKFFSITLPMIAPIFESVLLMAIIGSLKVCDLVISLTNGQPGGTTEVVMTYIYKFFFGNSGRNIEIGYASAMSAVTAVFLGLVTLVYVRGTGKMKEGQA